MFFKGKREAKILRVLAAALGVFLVAESGALSVPLSPLLMHSEIPQLANPAIDSACQAVLDVNDKLFTTPFQM